MYLNYLFIFIFFKKNWKYDIIFERLILLDFIIFFIINIVVYFIIDVIDDCFKVFEFVLVMMLINNLFVFFVLLFVVSLIVKELLVEVMMLEFWFVRVLGLFLRMLFGMDFFLVFFEIFILVIMYFVLFRLFLIV